MEASRPEGPRIFISAPPPRDYYESWLLLGMASASRATPASGWHRGHPKSPKYEARRPDTKWGRLRVDAEAYDR